MSSASIGAASLLTAAATTPGATPAAAGTAATAPAGSTTAEAPAPVTSGVGTAPTTTTQPSSTTTANAGTGAATGAAQGAQAAQAPAEEPFNAPMLDLPDDPNTHDVLNGLTKAMADKTVNATSVQRLFDFHQKMFDMEKAMTQVIIDGIVS